MQPSSPRTLAGAALIGLGALALLQNMGLLGGLATLVWAAALGAAGATFLAAFLRGRGWWAAIPGATLLGLAAAALVGSLPLRVAGELAGGMFLGAVGAGFLLVYIARQDHWWAVIPGGVMLTLAALALFAGPLGDASGALFFLGIGLTFGALTRLPGHAERLRWAIVPASVMLAMSAVVLLATTQLANIVAPLLLIGGGLALLYRTSVARHARGER